ncbi:MAG: STAS domain-containing protein [Candidatus Eremiobacteraeota bacterium]|nr:STAS domain-containing protein [Candidatus Eremiobacteraeota bacterium]
MALQLETIALPHPVTTLSGEFDTYRAKELRATLKHAKALCSTTIDFSNVTFMDASSLGCLAGWRAGMSGESVRFVGVRPHIARLFRMVGFDKIFAISEQAA